MDGSNALLLISVTQIDDRDASGVSNPCITWIRALDYSRITLESSGVFYNPEESPLPALPGVFGTPQFLDWGNASITRSVGITSTYTRYVSSTTFRMNGRTAVLNDLPGRFDPTSSKDSLNNRRRALNFQLVDDPSSMVGEILRVLPRYKCV